MSQAHQLLKTGHLYLWGDKLVRANREFSWSLLVIDRKTDMPAPPGAGVLHGYICVRGTWYEVSYDADGNRRVGGQVEIDLTQFHDIARPDPEHLLDGHVYSDGKWAFVAKRIDQADPYVLTLYRVNKILNTLRTTIIAGDLVGYAYDVKGHWRKMTLGNPMRDEPQLVLRICTDFDSEILPRLTHVAGSMQGYVAQ